MEWLVRRTGMLVTRFAIRSDGDTAYERARGKKCKTEVVRFSEKVMYKQLKGAGSSGSAESD